MPFHVQIGRAFRKAREYNLSEEQVRRAVVEPWLADRVIVLGDREWQPRDCTLLIVEGPRLEEHQLAHGDAWRFVERNGADATRRLIDSKAVPAVAVHAVDPQVRQAIEAAIAARGWRATDWGALGQGTAVAGVCVLPSGEDPRAAFSLGVAAGGLGPTRVLGLVDADAAAGEHAVAMLAQQLSVRSAP